MVVGSRKEQSLGRQGRVSAEATRSGSSRWARLLCAADAAAARAHAPGQAGPRERGGYAVRATRYGKPASRLGGPPPGPGYWLARRGGRVTLVRPPVLRVAFPPGGGLGGQRRRCDRHQGTGRAIVQEDRILTRERDSIDTHTTSSSTQPVNHTQNRNPRTHPRQTSRLHAHTHLPNTSRSENDANQQTTPPRITATLTQPHHARAHSPGEPSPARAPPTPPPAPPPAASPAAAPAAPAQPRRAGGG